MKEIDISELTDFLLEIRKSMLERVEKFKPVIDQLHPNYSYCALNFIRYLHLRTYKLRQYQDQLSNLGLSSIGHSERYTLANIENILYLLHYLQGKSFKGLYEFGNHPVNYYKSNELLEKNTTRLMGKPPRSMNAHIMVTLPTEAAEDYLLVRELIRAGMSNARINCSHDSPELWEKMIKHIKKGAREVGHSCQVYMDLAGPKLRTGFVKPFIPPEKKKPKNYIILKKGDLLTVHREPLEGENAWFDEKKEIQYPARISISIPSVIDDVHVGENIWFDDGAIGGVIQLVHPDYITVRITRAHEDGSRLRAEKGINLPESDLTLPSLTDEDLYNLSFVVKYADVVGYSFVRNSKDVELLQTKLSELGRTDIGIVLKIENRQAFDNLPSILLTAMKSPTIGVMIARGDLAVELGAERISEVQEQLLWLCEAAMIPNIWATQVLEGLAKEGVVTRAEITDAAMSSRAECVMLNKGPYILEAVQTLGNILKRMTAHQHKKKETLRALKVAQRFFEEYTG